VQRARASIRIEPRHVLKNMTLESISFLDPEDLEALKAPAASTGTPERPEEPPLGVECAWPMREFQL
jgi:hypothetical protein